MLAQERRRGEVQRIASAHRRRKWLGDAAQHRGEQFEAGQAAEKLAQQIPVTVAQAANMKRR
jgi:hypothetical protein